MLVKWIQKQNTVSSTGANKILKGLTNLPRMAHFIFSPRHTNLLKQLIFSLHTKLLE